ncbi:hypothetical protein ACJX0J_020096, partial [Zea mays]
WRIHGNGRHMQDLRETYQSDDLHVLLAKLLLDSLGIKGGPCAEWLEVIETMCNEILGNYTKKEDQLMSAVFDTREKQ